MDHDGDSGPHPACPRPRRLCRRPFSQGGGFWAFNLRALLLALAFLSSAHASEPSERLPDPALEARARAITGELRCVVCQGQSVDESNAPAAEGVRRLVRTRLAAGDSDEAAIEAVTARYGEQVRLDPRLTPTTILLWFGPALILALGGFGAWRYLCAQQPTAAAALSQSEHEALARAMREE